MPEYFFRSIIKYRVLILSISAILLAGALYLGKDVKPDFSVEQFFPAWDPAKITYQRYKQYFPKEDTGIILFWEEKDPLNTDTFHDMEKAAAIFEQLDLEDVSWIGDIEIPETVMLDGEEALSIHQLINRETLSDDYLKKRIDKYKNDPILSGYLWNSDLSILAIYGYLPQELNTDESRREIEGKLTNFLEPFSKPGRKLVLNGIPIVRARAIKTLAIDQSVLLGIGFILIFAILYYFFRHALQVFLCIFSILPAYIIVIAIMGICHKPISVLTSFMPLIIVVIGISDTIHILVHYRKIRATGLENHDAIAQSFSRLSTACFFTSLTTAVGYFSLISTKISIVVDFAVFTGTGVLLSYVAAIVYLPIFLSYYKKSQFNDKGQNTLWMNSFLNHADHQTRLRPKMILFISSIILMGSLYYATRIDVNAFMIDDMKKSHPLMKDYKWVENHNFGIFQLNLFLEGHSDKPLHSIDNLQWQETFINFVNDDALVLRIISMNHLFKQIRNEFININDTPDKLPSTDQEASDFLFIADSNFFKDVYIEEENVGQIIVFVKDTGSKHMVPFIKKIDAFLKASPPPVGSVISTGTTRMAQTTFENIISGFGSSLILAIVIIFFMITGLFRSFTYGFIALVINIAPLMFLLGFVAFMNYDIKPSTVLIFSIAFGIAVDDTIHYLGIFRQNQKDGVPRNVNISKTLKTSGKAMVMTTVIIGCGFSVLMVSSFEILFLLGLLSGLALLSAVVADIYALPSILSLMKGE
ncbi:MAG: MMPL family transporter [Proteobacteria bacterium]|nr:MMPL family transporter [Pseudomonadota bacterium]